MIALLHWTQFIVVVSPLILIAVFCINLIINAELNARRSRALLDKSIDDLFNSIREQIGRQRALHNNVGSIVEIETPFIRRFIEETRPEFVGKKAKIVGVINNKNYLATIDGGFEIVLSTDSITKVENTLEKS